MPHWRWPSCIWRVMPAALIPNGIGKQGAHSWASTLSLAAMTGSSWRKRLKYLPMSYYLMNFSQVSLRGAEIWHIWKQHHVIECFWKMMKSIFQIRSMQLQGDGLYTALLIKVFAYLLALRLQGHSVFSPLTITQIMRKLSREHDFREFLATHFHAPFSTT